MKNEDLINLLNELNYRLSTSEKINILDYVDQHKELLNEVISGDEHFDTPTPNIIFGVLTNGEIFVEVNGQQHTPADEFYKMATIQSTKLAHQVRDLEYEITMLEAKNKKHSDTNYALDNATTELRKALMAIRGNLSGAGY